MRNPKNFVVIVFMVVFVMSAMSVTSMVKNSAKGSYDTFAQGNECRTQGVFMPEPFADVLVAPVDSPTETDHFCSAQGGVRPPSFEELDDKTESGS